ncbi:MAG: M1 family aminopeptidase [Balneolales bacterium]
MNALKLFFITLIIVFATNCKTVKPIAEGQEDVLTKDTTPESTWEIPDDGEKHLRPRTWDLQHQKIWVRFNFEQKQVIGQTELFFTNLTSNNNELILDAKTMEFNSIYSVRSNEHLEFTQDSSIVTIHLTEQYEKGDSLYIGLDYMATPPNRGLYFVDPEQLDPTKPTQVWTLGQPEDNSFWLPTIDSPEERATQETWISVPETYQTLSNGALIESRRMPGDSLRTDYWRMNKPHSPYLFALVVGKYSIQKTWNHDVLFKYYTEPEYSQYHHLIYKNTEDILEYIENKTNISYPWGVYAQVPVHDFIASGMENTTATVLYDAIQIDEQAHLDVSHQGLIVHELAHQWFGNYVTSKNWANMPLNEGFANYFEILYTGSKQGADEASWGNLMNRDNYFLEALSRRRPIIFNRYKEPEDMYDRHTYDKAGQVLRMLHDYIGDKTWWSALNTYLTEYALKEVEIADLQLIFEQETGENLNWFFNQWFHQPGHPEIEISADTIDNELSVQIKQVQDIELQPVFNLHTVLEVTTSNTIVSYDIEINNPDSTYRFKLDGYLEDVILDPGSVQLAEIKQIGDWMVQLERLKHPSVTVREYSIRELAKEEWNFEIERSLLQIAKNDRSPGIRYSATKLLAANSHEGLSDFALTRTYPNEPDSRVRIQALYILEVMEGDKVKNHMEIMLNDTSYYVAAEAIKIYGKKYTDSAITKLAPFKNVKSYQHIIRAALAESLINNPDIDAYRILYDLASDHGDYEYIRTALAGILAFSEKQDLKDDIINLYREKLDDPYEYTREISKSALDYIEGNEK